MSNVVEQNATLVVLDTALFQDSDTVIAAIESLDPPASQRRKLDPETMTDKDWDEILDLVLSAKRVLTI